MRIVKFTVTLVAFALLGMLLVFPYLKPAMGDDSGMISIVNPAVQPSVIKVGDGFAVNATIVNNSNQTISVHNDCNGAFTVSFDNHVTTNMTKLCNFMAIQIVLKPGENITRSSLFSILGYKAISPGVVNATISASYIPVSLVSNATDNQTSANITSQSPINMTKSFQFTIENQTIPKPPVTPMPLDQFKSGIAAKDIQCKQGLQLVIRSEDSSPACVTSQTAQRLVSLGWGSNP